jgi:hypothetical protein
MGKGVIYIAEGKIVVGMILMYAVWFITILTVTDFF